jgi:hypothetical protein
MNARRHRPHRTSPESTLLAGVPALESLGIPPLRKNARHSRPSDSAQHDTRAAGDELAMGKLARELTTPCSVNAGG